MSNYTEKKQIIIRLENNEVKELKQYCLDHDINMTMAIKAGLLLLKNAKKEGEKINALVDIADMQEYAGIAL